MANFGWKITDDRQKAVLLAFQRCVDQGADRFIIEGISGPDELQEALELLLTDVCDPAQFRIRRAVRPGFVFLFEDLGAQFLCRIGEWIGNRQHGVVLVDAIRDVRERYRTGQL